MNKIAEFVQRTSFIVFWFATVLAVVLLMQALPALFVFISTNFGIFLPQLNLALKMPVDLTAWFYMAMSAAYTGVDRFAYYRQSSKLKYGQANVGNPEKLRRVIFVSFLLFVEASLLELIISAPMPLEALMSAFGSTCLLYVTGQKGIRAAGSNEGNHDTGHVEFYTNREYVEDPTSRDGYVPDVSLKSPSGNDLPDPAIMRGAVERAATPSTSPKKSIIDTAIEGVAKYAEGMEEKDRAKVEGNSEEVAVN
jgi:hypothetical protein